MEELEALLDKYVPATEALRTKLRKYDKAYKALSDENSALEAELQTAKDDSKEKIAARLKYGIMLGGYRFSPVIKPIESI